MAGVAEFEAKTIETVEDTYWVKERYQKMSAQLNLLDDGVKRSQLSERLNARYSTFSGIISEMQQTISLYETQRSRNLAEAQQKAEEEARRRRADLEVETRKNEFLAALKAVESLEYQASNAQELVQNAINKLPLVADYQEAAFYGQQLDAAIARISTLPTAEEWQARQANATPEQAAMQQQIAQEQSRLQASLNAERIKWGNHKNTGSPTITAGQRNN